MANPHLSRPILLMLYGFPGAGKTYLARQLCEYINAVHIEDGRIRNYVFSEPEYTAQENTSVNQLMEYMAEEFLKSGLSVIYDTNASKFLQRRALRDLARKAKATPILIWIQIDSSSAYERVSKRDRRKSDDKFATSHDEESFEKIAQQMQNPINTEDYIVLSGKHAFQTQRNMVIKKLYELGVITPVEGSGGIVKPGMVNLIPTPRARVDNKRRDIIIR